MRRALLIAALAAALVAAAGCGVGPGKGATNVSLRVTRDFGTAPIGAVTVAHGKGESTVMRLLMRHFKVATRYGGGFVESIGGVSGGTEGGRPVDWFFYVNGIEAAKGAAATSLHPGDHVWWDFHDWGAAQSVPAVVGSFPEPFRNGIEGRRVPVRVDCVQSVRKACQLVQTRLAAAGVPNAAPSVFGTEAGMETLRVVVGPWSIVRRELAAAQLEHGPQASGVFARPASDGHSIAVLDTRGRVARTLRAATGLIAATRYKTDPPLWIVSGTDTAGVQAAARAFDEGTLADHFAIAIAEGAVTPLPVVGR